MKKLFCIVFLLTGTLACAEHGSMRIETSPGTVGGVSHTKIETWDIDTDCCPCRCWSARTR